MELKTPHIPLGITRDAALKLLKELSYKVEEQADEKELFYKASTTEFECGFYIHDGIVSASWYNDPTGRDSQDGINKKVTLYLARYGDLDNWEDGINNGWIQFFTNNASEVGMAYGLHKDVLRFNDLSQRT